MITITNENNEILFNRLANESVDIICIDPPYLYLKNQKLEREFDEYKFFQECQRVLTKDGFIIMFGRGVSFYRWNCILADLGLNFKEEIIWDKNYTSSPVHTINRIHETISIFSKGKGILNKIKIPYVESRTIKDVGKVINDVNRLKTILNNEESFNHVLNYLNGNRTDLEKKRSTNYATSCQTKALGSQTVSPMIAIKEGMKVKSIISENREHYKTIHPTQKPPKLIERLLMLCLPKKVKIVIADFFGGSFSTMEAVVNLQKKYPELSFKGVSCEIDKEYFDAGYKRINSNI